MLYVSTKLVSVRSYELCVCVRVSLFCFSLTSAHLRELFWNSWALSKQRWPNVRDGGEVDQGVHECVSMCACVCDFSSKLGPEGPCEKSKRRERKPSPWERQLETRRLAVFLSPPYCSSLSPTSLYTGPAALRCVCLPSLPCLPRLTPVLPTSMPLPRRERKRERKGECRSW